MVETRAHVPPLRQAKHTERYVSPVSTYLSNTNHAEQTKRRLQNRQAQRRFRERKDEYLQTLEKKTSCLEKQYQELLEECNRKSEEACQARKEMETLSRENEDFRKRWRLIVLLLSLPINRAQYPASTLLGNEASQLLASTSITTEPAPLVSKDGIPDS